MLSGGSIVLGPQTGFNDQPYVQVELLDVDSVRVETLSEGGAGFNEIQRVTVLTQVASDLLTLSYDDEVTGAVSGSANAQAVRVSLEGLSAFEPGEIAVSGAVGGPWSIEFLGRYANTNVSPLQGAFGLGPYDSGFGIYPYNNVLMDTGANSILLVSDAAADLEANGYQTNGQYDEGGVAGTTTFDVSLPYRLDTKYTVTHEGGSQETLSVKIGDNVQTLSSPTIDLGGLPAQLGGIPGLVGMPVMVDRVTTLDLAHWNDQADLLTLEPMGVRFSDDVPPSNGHRYSVLADNRVKFDPDPLPGGPTPVWADIPFFTGEVRHRGKSQSGDFLLDTGAQLSMISTEMAFALGLDEDGDGDFMNEAIDKLPIGGVGGTVEVPLLVVEQFRMPTTEGVDLVWQDHDPEPVVQINPSGQSVIVNEAGGVTTYEVVLAAQPTTNVQITMTSPDGQLAFESQGNPGSTVLEFSSVDWDIPQLVQVSASHDTAVEGTHFGTISHSSTSADEYFDGLFIADMSVTIVDDDTLGPGVVVTYNGNMAHVTETALTDSYTVVLATQPDSDVTVFINSGSQLDTSLASLVFSPDNYNTPQTVHLSAVDDDLIEGTHTATLIHTVASSDSQYDGIAVGSLTAEIADNDLGLAMLVLDIAPGIDGIVGVDLLTSGLDMVFDSVTFDIQVSGAPYFHQMYFDFREMGTNGTGVLYFDLNPIYDQVIGDNDGPTVDEFSPPDDDAGVALSANLVIDFNADVQKGTGNIVIKKSSDDSVAETIAVTSDRVTIAADRVTIDPVLDFAEQTAYYVQIDSGSFEDVSGNPYTGIDASTTWNFNTRRLTVTDMAAAADVLVTQFSAGIDASVLNLYDSVAGSLGSADVTVVGANTGPVRGSIVLDDTNQQLIFIPTGGPLPPDIYTMTLRSADDGFREASGELLDGNNDETPGDDFTMSFTVTAPPAGTVTLSIPDFARGPGQLVNLPASAIGLPISIDDASGVTSLVVDVHYDPSLLNITDVVLTAGLLADWTVDLDISVFDVATVTASGTTALTGTSVEIVRLIANVPSDASYGDSQAIRLAGISVNNGTIAARGDLAVHKAVYLGDTDGSGIHSSADAFLTVQTALGLATGFSAHAWTDPLVSGDADGSGILAAADAFLIVQEALGLAESFVPDNPGILVTQVGGGIDPQFRIADGIPASVGGLVTVPVRLQIEPEADNVGGMDFDLFFDATQLSIDVPGGISSGADTAGGWAFTSTLVAPGHVRVGVFNTQGQAMEPGSREVARLQFRANTTAAVGLTAIDIQPVDAGANGLVWTAIDGSIEIGPPVDVRIGENPWHNLSIPYDVSGDGELTAADILLSIDYINQHLGDLVLPTRSEATLPFYDVNNDLACTAADVLALITEANAQAGARAEGERGDAVALGIPASSGLTSVASIALFNSKPQSAAFPANPCGPASAALACGLRLNEGLVGTQFFDERVVLHQSSDAVSAWHDELRTNEVLDDFVSRFPDLDAVLMDIVP